jgi:disulfide bond formation protein DsbB/peroxiredoxin
MTMSNEAVLVATRFFALLAIAAALLGVAALAGRHPALRPRWQRTERWLAPVAVPLAAGVAVVATAGSLLYSELAGFAPCTLCWVQRGFMYPLAAILVVVWATSRYESLRLVRWVAFGGMGVAAFHVLIERFPRLEPGGVCSVSNPCSFQWVSDLGFVTLPGMALAGFAAIAALLTVALDLPKRRPSTAAMRAKSPVLAGLVVLLAVVAVTTGRPAAIDPQTPLVQESSVTVTGAELVPYEPTRVPDPAVGQPAPAFAGTDFAGTATELVPAGEGPALVVFLAHWCGYCQEELPALVDWMESGGADGVRVIAVSAGASAQQANWPPSTWFAREGWPGAVVADGGAGAAKAYGVTAFPFAVVLDEEGTVVERHSGRWAIAELESVLGRAAALR